MPTYQQYWIFPSNFFHMALLSDQGLGGKMVITLSWRGEDVFLLIMPALLSEYVLTLALSEAMGSP